MLALLPGYLLIFGARVTDVSLATVRTLLLVRGQRLLAAAIGFFEVTIYILALGYVMGHLNDPISIVVYGLGFATGNVVGGWLEEKMAIGYLTVQIVTLICADELAADLRAAGFGVTIWQALGQEGEHRLINVTLPRRELPRLRQIVDRWDCQAFMAVQDTRTTRGGFFQRKAK